jgi:MoCo/4Fe-4S cofactor protein with predicted Tat translocation signal
MIELDVLSKADVAAEGQPKHWRSLAQRDGAPGLAALAGHEFHPAADIDAEPSGSDRRTFIKVMGASMALAGVGMAGCRRPVETVLPYVRQPEDIIPGVANYYATAMPLGGVVHPLLVESHEGRPTKVEGNPDHPAALGKSNLYAQASILNLYDPDRTRVVRREGSEVPFTEFVALARQLRANPETRLAILCEPTSSLTVARLRQQITAQFPNARWITYRPAGDDQEGLGVAAVAGSGIRPLYRFSQAQTIVSLDADFLSDPLTGVWNSREYAESRRVATPQDGMSRLYAIESTMTTTGGQADHRLRMKASHIPQFAAALAAALGESAGPAGAQQLRDPRARAFAEAIAEDARAGSTLFVAGATQPPAVHALCARLNAAYGAGAVEYVNTGAEEEAPLAESLPELVAAMNAGQVDALLMIGVNPVYDAPAQLNFAEALARVPASISLCSLRDETASRATWILPRAHYLEAWGDGRAIDGTISVIQPLIAPLYANARSEVEVLGLLASGETASGYDLVRETLAEQGLVTGNFEDGWRRLLHDGFLPNSAFPSAGPAGAEGAEMQLAPSADDQIELVIRPHASVMSGEFSNNAWMLELPEPVSKIVWDNVAVMSATTAEQLGVRFREGSYEGGVVRAGRINASTVTISVPGADAVTLPAWVQPGHPDGSITVHTGYGRVLETDRSLKPDRNLFARIFDVDTDHYRFGPIGNEIGTRVAHLRPPAGPAVIPSVQVEVAPDLHMIATTQDHGSMEGRPIIRMGTLDEFRQRPTFASEAVPRVAGVPFEEFPPIWGEENSAKADPRISEAMYSDHQWGMTVDLNTCSGCNACVVACQAENNINVVGKDQVARGREMHWIRLDRYYFGDDVNEATMALMPMMCQHCEYAPCESVCPVAATVHSPDGLNEMVYNRCIGTRYCSNNCPYKVRRYNWFNWSKEIPAEARMQLNPNVTTRFRGVMEKCTWCVQRIRAANQYAHIENRKIEDGEVQTACQQACPTDAIVFGDLNDPDSRVSRMKRVAQRYELLDEYNTRPRLSYLARLSNPNPRLAAALTATQPEPSA